MATAEEVRLTDRWWGSPDPNRRLPRVANSPYLKTRNQVGSGAMDEKWPITGRAGLAGVEPIDPDVEASDLRSGRWWQEVANRTVAAIAIGGVVGAVGRYETGLLWPVSTGGFPWTTFEINLVGSGLLAILLVLVTDLWVNRPLLRPILGTGVMGGFTTFSTFSVDTQRLLTDGHVGTAFIYVALTLAACAAATWLFGRLTRSLVERRLG
jgi:CrcB protein